MTTASAHARTKRQSKDDDALALKSLSLEQLGEVKVTSFSKSANSIAATPAAVYVISSQDILRSGATSIADALRLAPGVEVGRLSSTTWAISMRGLQNNFSKSVLVLIDGRSVYTTLFAGVYWDVQDLPLEDIDHIEVIRGPGGTIWGANAANGVINIVTKNAADTHGLRVSALAGTQDKTIDDLQIGSSVRRVDYRLYGRGFIRRHEYHTDGLNEDDWHQERLGFRADRVAGKATMFLQGMLYRGDSPHIIGTTPYYDQTSGGSLNAHWERASETDHGSYVQAFFDRTIRTDGLLGETRNTIDLDVLQHLRIGDRNRFTVGLGLRWSPYHVLSLVPADTVLPHTNLDHAYTGFVQDEVRLPQHLTLTLGAKLEDNNYSGFDAQPSGRLLWSPREQESVWLGITQAVTTPSDIEEGFLLQGSPAPGEVIQVLGNPRFKSEAVVAYEGGYRRQFSDRFFIDFAAYWNRYRRLQSFSPIVVSKSGDQTLLTITYDNQIHGATSGFELAPRFTITPEWRLSTGYSYLNSNFSAQGPTSDISATGSVNTYEHSSPRHLVFAQSEVDLPWQLQFDQVFRFASALPAQKVEAYETVDARLARPIGKNFRLEIVGQNLLQPHHDEWGTGDPTQPLVGINRAAYVRLTFRTPLTGH